MYIYIYMYIYMYVCMYEKIYYRLIKRFKNVTLKFQLYNDLLLKNHLNYLKHNIFEWFFKSITNL